MLYTGKGNTIIWSIFIPSIIVAYIIFIVFEHTYRSDENRKHIVAQLIQNTKNQDYIDGVILGGSNAVFSLSSELMSQLTESQWLNLALLSEGYSDKEYLKFIEMALSEDQRSSIKYVLYSSISPMKKGGIKNRQSALRDLFGNRPISYLPDKSIASHLKELIADGDHKERIYPLPLRTGDFDFSRYSCKKSTEIMIDFNPSTSDSEIWKWTSKQLSSLSKLFPKAKIILVSPSEFYGSNFNKSEYFSNIGIIKNAVDGLSSINKSSYSYIPQPEFPTIDFICDASSHANSLGREWRTRDLYHRLFMTNDEFKFTDSN